MAVGVAFPTGRSSADQRFCLTDRRAVPRPQDVLLDMKDLVPPGSVLTSVIPEAPGGDPSFRCTRAVWRSQEENGAPSPRLEDARWPVPWDEMASSLRPSSPSECGGNGESPGAASLHPKR